ncbi:hypothetical protein [Tabrizicola sp.]|uniref:hypothetical protein n=1 Tax=Tabrizicola sp. TaxID=2005166 RepID=UPI003F2D7CBA
MVLWTILAPILTLWMAFRSKLRGKDKFEFVFLLFFAWFLAAGSISVEPTFVSADWGFTIGVIASLGFWIGLHRLVTELTWPHRWILHIPLAGLSFAAILLGLLLLSYERSGVH